MQRIISACLAVGVLAFGSAGAYAAVGHVSAAGKTHHAAKHKAKKAKRHHARHHRRAHHAAAGSHATTAPASAAAPAAAAPAAAAEGRSAAAQEYGTRPGKGCGDKNHDHTGPPGNPSNTGCPHGG
jgi:hypothetical protein